jgi:hypothetical protein
MKSLVATLLTILILTIAATLHDIAKHTPKSDAVPDLRDEFLKLQLKHVGVLYENEQLKGLRMTTYACDLCGRQVIDEATPT